MTDLKSTSSYKDPNRKVGSQSETPHIKTVGQNVHVSGYQKFIINKNTRAITFQIKHQKFSYISQLLSDLNKTNNCNTIVDIGCNSGLSSFIASSQNFKNILSLDHDPEYINTLRKIKNECKITNINERIFSFGNEINEKFDVVFCGAIIHWIFSLTANFGNFDSIIQYLLLSTKKYLVIEWICENDPAINYFNHIKRNKKTEHEEYTTDNFEKSINKYVKIISKRAVDGPTRIIYFLQK